VEWNDGCTSPYPLVSEAGGVGEVRFQHRFCNAGYYFLTVRVTDSGGRTTEVRRDVVVNAPGVGALSGLGTLEQGAGAAAKGQSLRFALWAPVGGAATKSAAASAASGAGRPHFSLSGPFHFRSEQVGVPVVSGQSARLEGTGRFNGRPGYRFFIETQGSDRMRVRIIHTDPSGKDMVDYDNGDAQDAASKRSLVAEGGLTLSS
jgi:hypothetical protein